MNALIKFGFIACCYAAFTMPAMGQAGANLPARTAGWTWPAFIVVPLLVTLAIYLCGLINMWRGRARASIRPWAVISFIAGWLSLLIALDSPIHEIGEQLFWVHMTQHEIMMVVSAPLLVLGKPLVTFLWSFPRSWRESWGAFIKWKPASSAWKIFTAPLVAWMLHALALWGWHAPVLFDATLRSDLVHALQHISFLGTALIFWWALIHGHRGLGYGGALLYVFTTAVHTSILGAWMTFSSRIWYLPYAVTAPAWHLTALEDQQLGGLVMWIPAGTLLVALSLVLLVKWMAESDQRWQHTRAATIVNASSRKRLNALAGEGVPDGR
jgi:putative membrane protein